MKHINEEGLSIIKKWEKLELISYLCPAGKWTIGYGHTGPDVEEDMTINQAAADALLEEDCLKAEKIVTKYVKAGLDDNQFSALVSLVFNIGGTNFKSSTLLKKLNVDDYEGAANEFLRWVYAKGRRLNGLVGRREDERDLFLSEGKWA